MSFLQKFSGLLILGFSSFAVAAPYGNLDSYVFGNDLDGSGLFAHSNSVFAFYEVFDALEVHTQRSYELGIFFDGSPSTLIPLFDISETTVSSAIVDFTTGGILDLDDGFVEGTYAPDTTDFGFYLSTVDSLSSVIISTVFSNPALNGGIDKFGASELLVSNIPDTFTAMFFSEPPDASPELVYAVSFVKVSQVSLPSSMLLLSFGLLSLLRFRNRIHIS